MSHSSQKSVPSNLLSRLADRLEQAASTAWRPLPHQVPPDGVPGIDWTLWLLLAGRGTGKTDACAHYLDEHVNGPACDPRIPGGHRPAIIAPTLGDALDACVNGPSGLKAHNSTVRAVQATGGTYVRWPNGTEAKLFGAHGPEDVERLRAGGNRCVVWVEELAAWRKLDDCWDHMTFGLRVGPHPHAIASTTPKNRRKLRDLIADPATKVTRASTNDNPYLAANVRAKLIARYAGTRLGRQELDGELLTDVEGALWSYDQLADLRVDAAPEMVRIVVGVDPSGSDNAGSDEQGIIVAGKGYDGHYYVLADRSCKMPPAGWAARAVAAYREYSADWIVAETNYGGDMVVSTIKSADKAVPVQKVTASRGKRQRAEPVAAAYGDPTEPETWDKGYVHHVGLYDLLEDQMCTWVPESGASPDRMDALVWAMTKLGVGIGNTGDAFSAAWERLAADEQAAVEAGATPAGLAPPQSLGRLSDLTRR